MGGKCVFWWLVFLTWKFNTLWRWHGPVKWTHMVRNNWYLFYRNLFLSAISKLLSVFICPFFLSIFIEMALKFSSSYAANKKKIIVPLAGNLFFTSIFRPLSKKRDISERKRDYSLKRLSNRARNTKPIIHFSPVVIDITCLVCNFDLNASKESHTSTTTKEQEKRMSVENLVASGTLYSLFSFFGFCLLWAAA